MRCIDCGKTEGYDPPGFLCPKCGGLTELLQRKRVSVDDLLPGRGAPSVWRYRASLPVGRGSDPVTLNEGGTPLVRSARLGPKLGLNRLFFKVEGQNPTGSFKDRGMTVAVTRAVESGAKVLVCASTGNTSASLAAYASRAGLRSAVVLPSGKVAAGKLTQAVAHGARLVRVEDNFDRALQITSKAVAISKSLYLMNSINPYRIEGQKTVAFEIFEQLGNRVPDYVVLPVGNAGNISAVWKGFSDLKKLGATKTVPRLVGVQAEGASPMVEAYRQGRAPRPWTAPETVASAIRIGTPVSWKKAMAALRGSKGEALSVSDVEIVSARRSLSASEGIFVENASATPIAALGKLKGIPKAATVVCITTGHGLKEPIPEDWSDTSPPTAKDERELVRLLA
ncbi:MAG: threonine synthase [Thaumarchaeota archaeon]|nr:threonine synthase [Nitrososphaerota archaeon]